MERQRSRYYRASAAIMRKALRTYSKDFEKRLRAATSLQQMIEAANKPVKEEEIEKAIKKIWVPVSKNFGEQTFRQLMPGKKAIDFGRSNPITEDYWLAWVEKLIKGSLGQRITWITNYTRETFISAVDRIAYAGFEAGKGIPQIANEIMKDLNITEKYRAERIARTEVIGASNMSTQAGAQATGLELDKEWISFIDDKTRQSHIDLNREKVDMNEQFSNGLEVPGDPAGEAEDVINCRCTVGYVSKEDSGYNWGRDIN